MKYQHKKTCLGNRQATLLLCQFPWIQKTCHAKQNKTPKVNLFFWKTKLFENHKRYKRVHISFLSHSALWSENRQKTRLQFLLQVIFMNTSNWNQAKPIFSDSFLSFQGQRLIPLKRGHNGYKTLFEIVFLQVI